MDILMNAIHFQFFLPGDEVDCLPPYSRKRRFENIEHMKSSIAKIEHMKPGSLLPEDPPEDSPRSFLRAVWDERRDGSGGWFHHMYNLSASARGQHDPHQNA